MLIDGTVLHLHRLPTWHPAGAVTILTHVWVKAHYLNPDGSATQQGLGLLRHEAQHVRDQKEWHVFYWLSYMGLILGFLSLRGLWEWRAYKVSLLAEYQSRGYVPLSVQDAVIDSLCGPLYLWAMTRAWARKLVMDEVHRLEAGSAIGTHS